MNMNSNEVRNAFIDYFKNNDHRHVKSGSLVPENDPSLMFANSGMVQFKNVFTGMEQLDFKRATTSQKCVRAGGKHNDLENVGFTTRHHTFFEMLGNFSFGDYFKEQAILYAWNLITKEFKINENKLFFISHCESSTFDPREILKTFRGIVGSTCPIKSVSKQIKKMIFFIYKSRMVV